jgi:hypothetical protein
LAKVAIFTTNVDAENQTLINHKCDCGAPNRHFCKTRVTSWPSVLRHCQALSSKGFRYFFPTVFVAVVGGEKIKTPKGGKKKMNLSWRGAGILFCKLRLVGWLV